MARKYQLKRRAERQGETRQRIVEATVALHTTVGPAQTTVSAIAERAGVQRHTFYRHFPDERSLLMACSGLFEANHPVPAPQSWRSCDGPDARLRRGFDELFRYYETNAEALAPLFRDAEIHRPTRETLELRMGPVFEEMASVLAEPFRLAPARRRRVAAAIRLCLSFPAWRALRAAVKSHGEAVEVAVRAVTAQVS